SSDLEVLGVDTVGAAAVRPQRVAGADRVAEPSLAERPAIVLALGDEVDLLVGDLPHVGDPEVVGHRVECEAEGIAKAPGPDLGPRLSVHRVIAWVVATSSIAGMDLGAHQRVVGGN